MKTKSFCLACVISMCFTVPHSAADEFNYDEAKVPKYTLHDPLVAEDGSPVTSAAQWRETRREQILRLFENEVYGRRPALDIEQHVVKFEEATGDGITRRLLELFCMRKNQQDPSVVLQVLMFLPAERTGPIPAFVGLNFGGNHTVAEDPEIPVTENWVRNRQGITDNRATAASRGSAQSRWPVRDITDRGYAVATVYCGDIDPDYHDGFENGVHALDTDQPRTPASWGTISAWAWGLSRVMDYLETDEDIDNDRVAVMGHSRLGKTSLWAGATDPRFALVVSNNSGCGGAALSRRRFGETVKRINTSFPHWFCDNFKKYNDNEDACPVDQHMLIALIAPRPVLICSAEEDRWADPKGEFLAGKGAHEVYRLLGTDGLAAEEMPGLNEPVLSRIGYHIRPGEHDVKPEDWQIYMDFADKYFGRD